MKCYSHVICLILILMLDSKHAKQVNDVDEGVWTYLEGKLKE